MSDAAASEVWRTLCDPAVRDLGWLLSSADLLAGSPGAPLARPWAASAEAAEWLAELDRRPEPLRRMLAHANPTRLGRYAEYLLRYFATHAPALRLVAANLPLRSQGRTLGECDFLIETEQGERLHWELAVKCYLCAATSGAAVLGDFVGPTLVDRFDLKRIRLVEHQLRLTEREAFASLGHPGPWVAQMFVKGWLFYVTGDGVAIDDPPELNATHPRGFWVTHTAWPAMADAQAAGTRWIVLPRLAWLAPRRVAEEAAASGPFAPLSAGELAERVKGHPGPSLVAALTRQADGAWLETSRGFIVPDLWPERARAFAAP
ncbi:DUF1853 family protein [Burkholderia alba]|uniref:DUF1853 family protein n=1 Tax=Burkholderia alba TaxID=2683677 RepID=UPI002B05FBC4|nr:DUF1853 family protein [Burkholderia alba]